MNTKIVLGVVVVLACGAIAAVVALRGAESVLPELEASSARAAEQAESPVLSPAEGKVTFAAAPEEARREVAPVTTPKAAVEPASTAPERTARLVRGRVLDANAQPVAGLAIALEDGSTTAVSGAGGRFELETFAEAGRLRCVEEEWVTVREGVHRAGATFEPVVIVAPSIDLAGEVVDEGGEPLANARLGLDLPAGFDARFGAILDSTRERDFDVLSDEDGRFALDGVPGIEGGRLRALLDGYRMSEQPAPVVTDHGLLIVLARPEQPVRGALSGRVVDPDGRPVAEARVAAGLTTVLTDEDGLFHLDFARAVTADALVAVKAEHLPARMERPFAEDADNGGWPDFVELVLGGPPLVIRGHVVDREGKPQADIVAWIADTTPFGTIGMMPLPIESLAAGVPVPPQALESAAEMPEEDGDGYWDFDYGGAPPTAFWNYEVTDAFGAFEFRGLCDRPYRVRLLDRETLQMHTSELISAGTTEVVIEMPEASVFERVAGTVVDDSGTPVEGVQVGLRVDPYSARSRVFGGTSEFRMVQGGARVRTDAEGKFAFERVPREGVRLMLASDDIVPGEHVLREDEPRPEELTIAVDRRCHLQIELEDPSTADEFVVFDADGEQLEVHEISEGSFNVTTSGRIYGGRSRVVSVSGRAKRVELLLAGAVVDSLAIELWPGELNRVTR